MAKDIGRAKQFQKSLWKAAGWEWTEEKFDYRWIHKPLGTDWDNWKRQGLVPVPFCAYCGDNDLASGSQWANVHSLLKVPVNLCSTCYAQMAERLGFDKPSGPLPLRVRLIERFGAGGCCLILVLLLFGIVGLVAGPYLLK
jgi:hypothetical protein